MKNIMLSSNGYIHVNVCDVELEVSTYISAWGDIASKSFSGWRLASQSRSHIAKVVSNLYGKLNCGSMVVHHHNTK